MLVMLTLFQDEGDRQEAMHGIFKEIVEALEEDYPYNPIVAPFRPRTPVRILDCGCGDASFGLEVAEMLTQGEVSRCIPILALRTNS